MEIQIRTVTGTFVSLEEAERAAKELQGLGVPSDNISVIAGNDENRHAKYLKKAELANRTTAEAAARGASIGGGAGIVATLIAMSVPGVGPALIGGYLAVVLAGVGGGALMGSLLNMGIAREELPLYGEAVRRGAVILVAHVDHPQEEEAIAIMKRHGSRDVEERVNAAIPHPYPWDDEITNDDSIQASAASAGASS